MLTDRLFTPSTHLDVQEQMQGVKLTVEAMLRIQSPLSPHCDFLFKLMLHSKRDSVAESLTFTGYRSLHDDMSSS